MLGGNGLLFTSYTENVTSIETPDDTTVVVKTKKPDTRIVGGVFVYIIPKHIWGKQTVKQLMGSYRPKPPIVGSGPYIVTEFDSNTLVRMERNPNWRGKKPAFDELQWIKYGSSDAVERALTLGEIDMMPEVNPANFERLGNTENIETVKAPSPSFTELAFNMCPRAKCPDAKYNPAVQDRTVRQAIGFAVDRERINQIASRNTAFAGHGLLPMYYKDFYTEPEGELDYPTDVDRAREMLEQAGWVEGEGGVREKDGQRLSFDLFVRSESQQDRQAARLVNEMSKPIGVEFKVQPVSADKLTELTVREVDGKMAPDFDTFIWGWGGDPYDPGILLNLLTTKAIGGSSDSFYSNPEYDQLYDQQSGEFDTDARQAIVQQMIEISQRDLPYLVLTVDPYPAGLPHRPAGGRRAVVPEAGRRPHLRPGLVRALAGLHAADRGRRGHDRGRGRHERAALRADRSGRRHGRASARSSSSGAGAPTGRRSRSELSPRWLVGKVLAAFLTLIFVLVFNFFLFRVMGDPTSQLARLPRADPEEIQQLQAYYGLDKPLPGQFADYVGDTVRGDLGISQKTRREVWTEIKEALPWTLLLVGVGTLLATLIGTWLGIVAATRRGTRTDDGLLGFSLFTYAAPEYWIGIILILLFAVAVPIFPAGPSGDARARTHGSRACARRRRAPRAARHGDDADAARPVLRDHAQLDGGRPHRGLHHRQARHRPAVGARGAHATRCRTRCCRWSRCRRSSSGS